MVFRTQLFRKVTIVGIGLIGGSLGMAIKKNQLAKEVVGASQRNSSLMYALKSKAIDHASQDIVKAVRGADLVILATPVGTIVNLLSQIGPSLKRNCIVTDVGSTKVSVVESAQRNLPAYGFFVGSHPLAGSDKQGATYAHAQLFEHSDCIITPTEKTNRMARDKVKHFWTKLGANVKVMSPEEHDQILSYISHLPHLLAYGLIDTIPEKFLSYAAKGLKDTTRIAASSPKMWNDISLSNSKNIVKSLDELVAKLSTIRKSIVSKDEKLLMDLFQQAKTKRDKLNKNE